MSTKKFSKQEAKAGSQYPTTLEFISFETVKSYLDPDGACSWVPLVPPRQTKLSRITRYNQSTWFLCSPKVRKGESSETRSILHADHILNRCMVHTYFWDCPSIWYMAPIYMADS